MDAMVELAIDGFPLDPKDPDIAFHRDLSAWLEVQNGPKVPVPLRIALFPNNDGTGYGLRWSGFNGRANTLACWLVARLNTSSLTSSAS